MARLALRLARRITNNVEQGKHVFSFRKSRQRKRSLYDPNQTIRHPSFNFRNHYRSILLSETECNPITNSGTYDLHKSLPPAVHLPPGAKPGEGETDKPREMTEQERKWWSSPYLRMLSSPIRLCAETDHYLPSDLLLRLSYLRLPASRLSGTAPSLTIIPDGIQHTKYTARRAGQGFHVLCLREAVDEMLQKASYKRVTRESTVIHNPRLADQLAHLLRLRVLQELERLIERIRHQPRLPRRNEGNSHPIIRRLTRDEFTCIKTTETSPFKSTVAVIVVPPVNRNPITKQRPQPSMSALPLEQTSSIPTKSFPPLSILMPVQTGSQSCFKEPAQGGLLPAETVPFYNGLAAFPHASQRAALHDLLSRLVNLESRLNYKKGTPGSKPSHAFLLCSNSENVKRGDVAEVAIALWRLRMFEGGGWGKNAHRWSLGTDHGIQKIL